MKNDDNLYIAKIRANKTYDNGITRDYEFTFHIYALNYEDAKSKIELTISSRSILFEVTHKLIEFELSEPIAPRGMIS